MAKVSPTQRALAHIRKLGHTAQVVERFCAFSKRRIDLFGFIDIVYLDGTNIVGVQVTSGDHHAHRREKILAEPKALAWIKHGGKIEVWSFSKRGERGKAKRWTLRCERIHPEEAVAC